MRYLTLKKYALQTLGDRPGIGVGAVVKEIVDSLPDYKLFEVALHDGHLFEDLLSLRENLIVSLEKDLVVEEPVGMPFPKKTGFLLARLRL